MFLKWIRNSKLKTCVYIHVCYLRICIYLVVLLHYFLKLLHYYFFPCSKRTNVFTVSIFMGKMSWKENWVYITGHFRSDQNGSVQCITQSARGWACTLSASSLWLWRRSVDVGIIHLRRESPARWGLRCTAPCFWCSTCSIKPRCLSKTMLLAEGATQMSVSFPWYLSAQDLRRPVKWTPPVLLYTHHGGASGSWLRKHQTVHMRPTLSSLPVKEGRRGEGRAISVMIAHCLPPLTHLVPTNLIVYPHRQACQTRKLTRAK